MNNINLEVYKDKVAGCWAGKNIGGTLGAPFEGQTEMHDIDFYTQDLSGKSEPNDDLDLQLVWLEAIKSHGISNITPQLLGEYWLGIINGPWNEYGIAKMNMRAGLMPPMSGSCNNEKWRYSNGAWIRSEIWACCFPGAPDEAIKYAYMDACVDHCGEGIYAEMFTAALEAAAFIVDDYFELIEIALKKIPAKSRIAQSVNIARAAYKDGKSWQTAREELVKASEDIGWFQAPANIGFVIIGLLYGEGDFGKSICLAVNCGDDTDCTAATLGSILGIINGYSNLPEKWLKPIGKSIINICINPFFAVPRTIDDLTEEVVDETLSHNKKLSPVSIDSGLSKIEDEYFKSLKSSDQAEKIWNKSAFELCTDLPHIQIITDYIDDPCIKSSESKKVRLKIKPKFKVYETIVSVKWILPEDWEISPAPQNRIFISALRMLAEQEFVITPGKLNGGFVYIQLEIKDNERMAPYVITLPFQVQDTVKTSYSQI